MRRYNMKPQINILFIVHKIIEDKIETQVEYHISSSAYGVFESIIRNEPSEQGKIEPTDYFFDELFQCFLILAHANIRLIYKGEKGFLHPIIGYVTSTKNTNIGYYQIKGRKGSPSLPNNSMAMRAQASASARA